MKRAIVVVALALLLSSCTSTAPDESPLPDGITLDVHQNRTDYDVRRLQIAVTNDTGGELGITGLEFASEQFVEPVSWHKDSTTIPDGATVDLPVFLAEASCTTAETPMSVTVDYELADGSRGTGVGMPVDRIGRMPTLRVEDCLARSVAEVAALEIRDLPRMVPGGAEIVLDVTPTAGEGSIRLSAVGGTTLLAQVDESTGDRIAERPLDITVTGGDAPSRIAFTVAPGRCDPHAIAEDKRGTVFGFIVESPEGVGTVYVRSPDEVRQAIYTFVSATCSAG